jgi:hypothetical protein
MGQDICTLTMGLHLSRTDMMLGDDKVGRYSGGMIAWIGVHVPGDTQVGTDTHMDAYMCMGQVCVYSRVCIHGNTLR